VLVVARASCLLAKREAWAPSVPNSDEWTSRLASQSVSVAEDDSGIVGFMTLGEAGYIDLAYVRPDRIGTGAGSEIYKNVENASRELKQMRLFSDASEVAKPYLEQRAWVVKKTQRIKRNGISLTNHQMEKLFS
jgi:putative acetyltransferase